MRLFMAAFPSEEFLSEVRDVQRKLNKIKRNFRFVNLEQLHLTIKFVGSDVSFETYEELSKELSNISFEKKPLVEVEKLMFGFPGQQYPNIMFFSVWSNELLTQLIEHSNEVVRNLGLEDTIRRKDPKRHLSHITFARSKRSTSKSLTRNTRDEISKIEIPQMEFEISELSLMESVLTPTGPVYRKLTSVPIG